jgi:hypothetical protein
MKPMRDDIVLEGAIPPGGIVELLADIEATCATGVLRYESATEGKGTIALVRGQFAEEQAPDRKQRDPVEVLLKLREGRFFLQQQLPPLPVSSGDHLVKTGSLAVHVSSELMRYCELAGLTGVLRLTRPPQSVELFYERGELAEVRVGGAGGIEFQEVFGWEDGRFTIEAHRTHSPALAPPSSMSPVDVSARTAIGTPLERDVRSTTQDLGGSSEASFLRVVEMSLEDLLRERSERSPAARTGPVIPQLPAVRVTQRPPGALPLGIASEPVRGESTVRVIYLAAERAPSDEDRRPAMDLNVPLPGEGRGSAKPDLPRNTAISALDDAGRLRQSKWPESLQRGSREDEVTTQFDTASHAAVDLGRLPTMLADSSELENDLLTVPPPGRAPTMTDTAKQDHAPPAVGGPAASTAAAQPADALTTAKWVALTCLVLVACLAVLAQLPPIE